MKGLTPALLLASAVMLGCDGRLRVFTRVTGEGGAAGDGTSEVAGTGEGGQPESVTGMGGAAVAGAGGASDAGGLWIDDFEDRDTHANSPLGWWYKANDGTGTQTLAVEPSSGKTTGGYALHSYGKNFTSWGAFVGVNFAGEAAIDASAWSELRFWARVATGANDHVTLDLIGVGDVRYYAPALTLVDSWAQYRVKLVDFHGPNRTPLDPTMLQGLQFEIGASSRVDIWLDDVELAP